MTVAITEVEQNSSMELSSERILEQLELLIQDQVFRSSKRSIEFLRFVVEQTLKGSADQIKERTIGVEVFGRAPSYDTNADHVVRTAAIELRKRLAIYYGEERHRSELRMSLVPGSYVPRFTMPTQPAAPDTVPSQTPDSPSIVATAEISIVPAESLSVSPGPPNRRRMFLYAAATLAALLLVGILGLGKYHSRSAQDLFWRPLLDTPGSVLLAVGDVPNGPPTPITDELSESSLPMIHAASSPSVPFADAVTIAGVVGILESHGKKVLIRRESTSTFSDLREGAVVLIGSTSVAWTDISNT